MWGSWRPAPQDVGVGGRKSGHIEVFWSGSFHAFSGPPDATAAPGKPGGTR